VTQVEKEDRQKQKAEEREDGILGVSGGDEGGYEFVARGEELFLLPMGGFVVCPQQVAIVRPHTLVA
jgi:hypothetical protein